MSKLTNSKIKRIADGFKPSSMDNRLHRASHALQGTLTSSAIGVINGVLVLNPTGYGDFTQYQTIYDEFRVIGVRLELLSRQQYSVTAINTLVAVVFDNDDSNPTTSLLAASDYNTCQMFSSIFQHGTGKSQLLTYTWLRPTVGAPIPWVDIANPSGSLGSVKFYSAGLTGLTAYLDYHVTLMVEYRGRR